MYRKEIIYMGLHKNGSRVGSAGFMKVENKDAQSRLFLKLQNIPRGISGRFPIRIYDGEDWKEIDGVTVREGNGVWEEKTDDITDNIRLQIILPEGYLIEGQGKSAGRKSQGRTEEERTSRGRMGEEQTEERMTHGRMGGEQTEERETLGRKGEEQTEERAARKGTAEEEAGGERIIYKSLSEDRMARQSTGEEQAEDRAVQKRITEGTAEREQIKERTAPERIRIFQDAEIAHRAQRREPLRAEPANEEMPQPCNVKEDKWEQILSSYEQIRPYGDERVYVKLEPKDFIILQSKYQHLVNNSFLLHGFYNYRYVILGKEKDFYLGVPGVFYEREKMVALMFGFEAFECPGGVAKPGEFGYYLRKVEL